MAVAVYRFARDLRLTNHAGLIAASAQGAVLPVLIVDRHLATRLAASPRRAAFFCAAVASLDAALRERGTRLLVRRANAGSALKQIARATGAHAVAWSASFDRTGMLADERLQSEIEEAGLRAVIVPDAAAISPEETTAARPSVGDGYRAFVPYYEVWRSLQPAEAPPYALAFARSDLQSERLPEPAEFNSTASLPTDVGETHVQARFERFLGGAGLQYAATINLPADDQTSHLSADLSFGTIAARSIVKQTRERIEDPFLLTEERASLKHFLRSIALRDFFLQLSWYHPRTEHEPLQERMRSFSFVSSHPQLDAWRSGRTGYPLVDAGIRQLHATGWMHPRVRAIAASFLCFDLGVDWRVGMAEWDRFLIEDEPALAIGNWQWVAAVGADLAAYPRIYNPLKQARRFDPMSVYARTWISELAHLPPGAIAAGRMPTAQMQLALYANDAYPDPVVDHERAAREFLERYAQFRTLSDRQASR